MTNGEMSKASETNSAVDVPLKKCGRCGERKPLTAFYTVGKGTGTFGRHGYCKPCANAWAYARRVRKPKPVYPEGMTRCSRCERIKALDDFRPHARRPNKRSSWCRECERDYGVAWARQNGRTERGKELANARKREEWRAGGIKHRARAYAHLAIYFGDLVQQPCEVCGSLTVQAHHHDYAKPLEVRWLCTRHHGEVHRIHKESKRP